MAVFEVTYTRRTWRWSGVVLRDTAQKNLKSGQWRSRGPSRAAKQNVDIGVTPAMLNVMDSAATPHAITFAFDAHRHGEGVTLPIGDAALLGVMLMGWRHQQHFGSLSFLMHGSASKWRAFKSSESLAHDLERVAAGDDATAAGRFADLAQTYWVEARVLAERDEVMSAAPSTDASLSAPRL